MIPAAWIASDATKKWFWSLTKSFRATNEQSTEVMPKKAFTFIDCLLIHPNSVFTAVELLLLPIPTFQVQERERREREAFWFGWKGNWAGAIEKWEDTKKSCSRFKDYGYGLQYFPPGKTNGNLPRISYHKRDNGEDPDLKCCAWDDKESLIWTLSSHLDTLWLERGESDVAVKSVHTTSWVNVINVEFQRISKGQEESKKENGRSTVPPKNSGEWYF